MIRVTVQGTRYDFDQEHLLVAEARELKTYTGLTPPRWAMGIDEGDPDAVAFLIFLSKKRAGETLRFSDLDNLDYADIEIEPVEEPADAADAGQEGEVPAGDPTGPPPGTGTTPTDGSGATSPPSPTTSSTPPATSAA
ncbi:hypothetical protein [Streptomyces tendae]|uniref:hypothetical protein n=1 Tax=Streptomyces tendae TaxID=1932 RepID=UPI003EB7B0BF